MSMFDVFSNAKAAGAATGGLVVGGVSVNFYHQLTTVRANKKLERRLGVINAEVQERAIKKVAILKALAYRDGEFCLNEKVFLYRYIVNSPELQADVKVALAKELEESPPNTLSEIWKCIRDTLSFSDLFTSEEEAAGFVAVMKNLASCDGEFSKAEREHVLKVCSNCKIPTNAYKQQL